MKVAIEVPWFVGPWGLILRNAKPCDFIPISGLLGFFEWEWRCKKLELASVAKWMTYEEMLGKVGAP